MIGCARGLPHRRERGAGGRGDVGRQDLRPCAVLRGHGAAAVVVDNVQGRSVLCGRMRRGAVDRRHIASSSLEAQGALFTGGGDERLL